MASGKQSKLDFDGIRLEVTSAEAADKIISIMTKLGCSANIASQVADHLVEASLSGVESHGVIESTHSLNIAVRGTRFEALQSTTCKNTLKRKTRRSFLTPRKQRNSKLCVKLRI